MRFLLRLPLSLLLLGPWAVACAGGGAPGVPCNQDDDCPSLQRCLLGACTLAVVPGGDPPGRPGGDAGVAPASPPSSPPSSSGDVGTQHEGGEADAGTGGDAGVPGDSWPLPGFAHRMRVEIAWSGEVLAGFPVLVELDAAEVAALGLAADGRDLRVLDENGARLPHELAALDADGASLWVRVDWLEAGAALFVYGGNVEASDESDPSAVFGEGYASVWHLDGDGRDSLGLAPGSVEPGVTFEEGPLGLAARFGGDARIDLGQGLPHAQGREAVTLSVWLRRDADIAAELISLAAGAPARPNESRVALGLDPGGRLKIFGREQDDISSRTVAADGVAPEGAWVHVAGVFDVANARLALFVDGEEVASRDFGADFAVARFPDTPSPHGSLGSDDHGAGSYFLIGALDEARIAHVARSSAWIAAEHESRGGGLVEKGAVESRP